MSENITENLFRTLRDELLAGRWEAGQRLPSERALAEQHGVNRVSVRGAVGRLVALGLVTVKRGDGIRATGLREAASLDLIGHLLEASERHDVPVDVVRDLLEIRRMVAAEAVALACARATDEDVAHLKELAAAQAARMDDPPAFRRGDVAFARAVLTAGGNMALQLLLNTIERFYAARPEVGAALLADPAVTLASYYATLSLIEGRDAVRARATVRDALEAIDAAALQRLKGR
jgi:GntR family transcriptional regulator, transcriptional repressor for pyruvate dehydrogenase complex